LPDEGRRKAGCFLGTALAMAEFSQAGTIRPPFIFAKPAFTSSESHSACAVNAACSSVQERPFAVQGCVLKTIGLRSQT
jgi:hypothetical protein